MSGAESTPEILDIMEILLTAEVINQYPVLEKNDLSPKFREFFSVNGSDEGLNRPFFVSEGLISKIFGIENAYGLIKQNPFVGFEEFGKRLNITSLEPAVRWFLKRGGALRIRKNPALAYYVESAGLADISYRAVRAANPRYEDTRRCIEARLSAILGKDEEMRAARDLIIISAPEEIEYYRENLVYTTQQEEILQKIEVALKNRDFLNDKRIYEFGKLLFVGPPGTGKTSLALSLARELHMPILEVRLAMVTSQYLGETSKNIDRIFDLARRLSPCILFIDEFDFVGKSRVTDDNAAMKRAVNMLLKNIDTISFIRNGVLLIGATNHPKILDEAAWRRFDEVVEFPLPDEEMRRNILEKITASLDCTCDFESLAARTEGFSGADLRIMVKEALLSALIRDHTAVEAADIEKGMEVVRNRDTIRHSAW